MGKKMDCSQLAELFARNQDFSLTDAQYADKFGKPLPKSNSYIKSLRFPVAKIANAHGYTIEVKDPVIIPRTISFKKIQ